MYGQGIEGYAQGIDGVHGQLQTTSPEQAVPSAARLKMPIALNPLAERQKQKQ
jgi:hypothetical protein